MEVLKLFEESGLRSAHFAKKIGHSRNYIVHWRNNGAMNTEKAELVVKEIIRSALALSRADLEKSDFLKLVEENGITVQMVADKVGMSRQGIYKALEGGLSEDQKERIESAVRSLGRELLVKARRIKERMAA